MEEVRSLRADEAERPVEPSERHDGAGRGTESRRHPASREGSRWRGAALVALLLFGVAGGARADTVSYQKGDGKGAVSETDDITLDETQPDTNLDFPNENPAGACVVDQSNHQHCLVKFPNIIGTGTDRIPPGSLIVSATLTMYMTNTGTDCPIVYQVTESWTESEGTWNDRQAGVPWSDPGADGTTSRKAVAEGVIPCNTVNGSYESLDVTTSVQNWSDGEANEGWVFVNDANNDGIDYRTSDFATVAERPELTVEFIPAVFYSIGTNAGDLKTGSPDITIASGLATLDVAQTQDIGVGDVINYAGGPVYIYQVVSPTQFGVQTRNGGLPADVPGPGVAVTSIERAFNSISDAVSQSSDGSHLGTADLTLAGRRLTWVCYDDGPFNVGTTTSITGYTTDATHFITLTVAGASQVASGQSQRHAGIEGTGARMEATAGSIRLLDLNQAYTTVEWLELDGNDATVVGVRVSAGAGNQLRNMILHNFGGGAGMDWANSAVWVDSGDAEMRNSVVYFYDGDGFSTQSSTTMAVDNSTFYGGRIPESEAIECRGICDVTNVIAATRQNFALFHKQASGTLTVNNSLSEDGSADDYLGSGNLVNRPAIDQFVSLDPGAIDLHLRPGADAIDAGKDLSASFTNDIDEHARPQGAAWDIGADESGFRAGKRNFRSIGVAGATGGGTVDVTSLSDLVSGNLTAFATANRGRGDVITIPCPDPPTCTGGVDYTVARVLDDTNLQLTTLYAGPTTAGTSYLIRRQYSTLEDWWDCVDNTVACAFFPSSVTDPSLIVDDRSEVGIVYRDPPDNGLKLTGGVRMNGATTDADHTITLTVDPPNRHNGVVGGGVVIDAQNFDREVSIRTGYFTLEWMEFVNCTGAPNLSPVEVWGDLVSGDPTTNVLLQNLMIHAFYFDGASNSGIDIAGPVGSNTSITVRNTMIWDGDERGIEGDDAGTSAVIENVTVDGMFVNGIWADQSDFTIRNSIVTHTNPAPALYDLDISDASGTVAGTNNTTMDASAAMPRSATPTPARASTPASSSWPRTPTFT